MGRSWSACYEASLMIYNIMGAVEIRKRACKYIDVTITPESDSTQPSSRFVETLTKRTEGSGCNDKEPDAIKNDRVLIQRKKCKFKGNGVVELIK